MAKMNKEAILKLCKDINQKSGEGTIYSLDGKYANAKIPRWSTGLVDLDSIIGGGMPEGRIVEIYGAEGSGKTTLLHHLTARHEMAMNIPIEGTFDASRARVMGNRKQQLLVFRAKYGEQAFNKMMKFAQVGMPIIGVDSVPSMMPKEDVEKVLKGADKDTIEELRLGGIPRLMTKYLPPFEQVIELSGTTAIFVNQIRDKVGVLSFGDKEDTPGGHKLKHAYSLRLKCARRAWVEIPNYNPANSSEKEKIGFIQKIKVVKSKVNEPLGECELVCIFDRGYISFDELENVRKEVMKTKREYYKGVK